MNILVVGGGSIGKRHISNLKRLDFSNIWVLKRRPSAEFEENQGVKVITSYKEAYELELDCIFVCTPTSMHVEPLELAVAKGVHIFMEKPLIHSMSGLNSAIELMQSYGKVFFIGFMLRYHPLVKKVKDILDSGLLGKVYNARFSFGSYLPYWHPWEDYKTSYASRKELGGGVINTITHELDLIQYFFGSPKSIKCESFNTGMLDIEVEEMVEAIFRYEDKLVTLHLDYLQKDYDRNIKILCENGKIQWDWHDDLIKIKKHNEDLIVIKNDEDFEVNDLYVSELKIFFDLIEKKELVHELDFNHAIENTNLMLKMHSQSTVIK